MCVCVCLCVCVCIDNMRVKGEGGNKGETSTRQRERKMNPHKYVYSCTHQPEPYKSPHDLPMQKAGAIKEPLSHTSELTVSYMLD